MIKTIVLSLSFLISILGGCATTASDPYTPSIASLEADETLVMKLGACNWRCTAGVIKFKEKTALHNGHQLELTGQEITDLDTYFTLGKTPEENMAQGWCSLPIYIIFDVQKDESVTETRKGLIYPCSFEGQSGIKPIDLVTHLTKTPTEKPYWRMSPQERAEYSAKMDEMPIKERYKNYQSEGNLAHSIIQNAKQP